MDPEKNSGSEVQESSAHTKSIELLPTNDNDLSQEKKETIQNYLDWVVNTPEFKEDLKKRIDDYFKEYY